METTSKKNGFFIFGICERFVTILRKKMLLLLKILTVKTIRCSWFAKTNWIYIFDVPVTFGREEDASRKSEREKTYWIIDAVYIIE